MLKMSWHAKTGTQNSRRLPQELASAMYATRDKQYHSKATQRIQVLSMHEGGGDQKTNMVLEMSIEFHDFVQYAF